MQHARRATGDIYYMLNLSKLTHTVRCAEKGRGGNVIDNWKGTEILEEDEKITSIPRSSTTLKFSIDRYENKVCNSLGKGTLLPTKKACVHMCAHVENTHQLPSCGMMELDSSKLALLSG